MMKWMLDEFLLNIPYDCMNFISYASYRNNLRKKVKFWPKIKIPVALDIKIWGFQLKRAEGGSRDKKMQENFEKLTVDRWLGDRSVEGPVDQFVGAENLKRPPCASFIPFSPPELATPSHPCFQKTILAIFRTNCRLRTWFWDTLN